MRDKCKGLRIESFVRYFLDIVGILRLGFEPK